MRGIRKRRRNKHIIVWNSISEKSAHSILARFYSPDICRYSVERRKNDEWIPRNTMPNSTGWSVCVCVRSALYENELTKNVVFNISDQRPAPLTEIMFCWNMISNTQHKWTTRIPTCSQFHCEFLFLFFFLIDFVRRILIFVRLCFAAVRHRIDDDLCYRASSENLKNMLNGLRVITVNNVILIG